MVTKGTYRPVLDNELGGFRADGDTVLVRELGSMHAAEVSPDATLAEVIHALKRLPGAKDPDSGFLVAFCHHGQPVPDPLCVTPEDYERTIMMRC